MHDDRLAPRSARRPGWRHMAGAAMALTAGLVAADPGRAATLRFDGTVMTGLANPRGLAFGPDGALYVAEAGRGGDGPAIPGPEGQQVRFGLTGGISRYKDGMQELFLAGLPSLAAAGGAQAVGVQDLAFGNDGALYAIVGLGADPAVRNGALDGQAGAELLGTLVAIAGGTASLVADIAAVEGATDPDGAGADSNPFSLVARDDGFVVTDAGGNTVLSVDASGAVSVEAVVPPGLNPLDFGPPVFQAVPTGLALAPDGGVVFGQLTGFPFPEGLAQVYGLEGGALSVLAGGFTNLIDVAVGADGTIYALELDSDSLLNPGTTGALYAIGPDGMKTLLFGGLDNPTGLALGSRGDIYISTGGFSPTDGSVIRLSPVPLPAALPALAGGLAVLLGWKARARRTGGGHPAA